ncbi:hypothetical protein CCR87_02940 [Rhodobaculum claviforme]|uniref:Uncharacterized protein n=2 Tax=Rhodobaculum claviforme TaxID=1549854 RepID=A0A934TIJ6_9RHOB|nr:hypothetical protein [Rhodobaculum claviforme]
MRDPDAPTLSENLRFELSRLSRLARYSEFGPIQALGTHLGVVGFIMRVWRRHELPLMLGGAGFSVAMFAVDGYLLPSAGTQHVAAQVLGWGSLASSVGLALWRVLNLHRPRKHEDGQSQRATLSRRFFMEPPPDGSQPDHVTITDLVSDSDDHPIITVGRPQRPINRAAVDLSVAKALMKTQRITIRMAADGTPFHATRNDIMRLSQEKAEKIQREALQIMRREAIRNRTAFFDSPKIALRDLKPEGDGLVCELGQSSYFATCLTNDLSAQCLAFPDGSLETARPIVALYPSVAVASGSRQHRLQPLDKCRRLSNHIGSVVLAVSADGIPVLCFQGQGARINAGRVVLSGAGSIDLEDLERSGAGDDLGGVIRHGMARELLEETGVIPQDSTRRCDRALLARHAGHIRLAGVYRDLRRGGLPIFVGFCRMEADIATLEGRQHHYPGLRHSVAETRLVDKLEHVAIADAEAMGHYLETQIRGTATFRCDPSDQLLLMRELLRLKPMQDHFNAALNR